LKPSSKRFCFPSKLGAEPGWIQKQIAIFESEFLQTLGDYSKMIKSTIDRVKMYVYGKEESSFKQDENGSVSLISPIDMRECLSK